MKRKDVKHGVIYHASYEDLAGVGTVEVTEADYEDYGSDDYIICTKVITMPDSWGTDGIEVGGHLDISCKKLFEVGDFQASFDWDGWRTLDA